METMSRINLAFKYMKSKHGLQTRKGNGEMYWQHPRRVAGYAWAYKDSYMIEDILIIALLHDIVEDTNGTFKEIDGLFGAMVADTVRELTSISKQEMLENFETKAHYLSVKMTEMSDYALVVKLCDRLDNIRSLKGMNDAFKFRQIKDTEYIIDYLYKNRTFITPTQHVVMAEITKSISHLNPMHKDSLEIPDAIDLGFEFDLIVNSLDDESRGSLAVEIGNINVLLAKLKELN